MKGLYIMGRSGNVIATGGHPPLPSDQMRSRASDLLKTQSPDPVLFLDEADGNILLIFMAPFSGADGAGAEVVLVGSVAVSSDIVSGIGAAAGGDNALSLYQRLGEDMVRIDPEGNLPMASVEGEEAKRVLEAQQVFLSTKGRLTYGATRRIVGTPWYLRMELAVGDELGWLNLLDRKEIAIILGSLLIVDIILLLLIVRRFQRQGAEYRRGHAYLVRRLQSRQALFDGIARTINAVVGVKDQKGRYSYANSAFGDFVGRDPTEVLGLDDAALFSENVAKLIKGLDSDALSSVQPVSSLEDVSLEGRDLHLRLSTFALRDAEKKPTGVMMVAQDVTDPVMMARQRQTSLQQTIAALSDTVGLADPYLSGHGVKVRNLAMAVGRLLSVTETEMAAIETGAILSQIGKLGVPHEILTKEGRLTPQEFEVMKTHIQHTLRVVEGIDFQHPVQTALAHMYERMDGSGYPKGLSAADISIMGRILGAADIFIARTSPRSYRNAISPAEALETFDYAPEKYDRMVIDGIRIVENL
ncbi:MAG: HD-GYP domain-containing protein [Magnetospiraceae bacterium]